MPFVMMIAIVNVVPIQNGQRFLWMKKMTEFSWEQHTKECTEEHFPSVCGKPCICKLEYMKNDN